VMIDEASRGRSTASKQLASISRRQIYYVRSEMRLLAGDCGVWFELAQIFALQGKTAHILNFRARGCRPCKPVLGLSS
jgi:hypothetical protein